MDIQTRLVHAGEERINGAVVTPIFQSSTFVSPKEEEYHDIRYLRLNNTPNHRALHAKLSAVCGGEDALVAGSGMAAITTALMTVLNSGRSPADPRLPLRGHAQLCDARCAGLGAELRLYRRQRA